MGWISWVLGERDLEPSRSGSSLEIRWGPAMEGWCVGIGGVVGVISASRGEEYVRWRTWCRFLPFAGY